MENIKVERRDDEVTLLIEVPREELLRKEEEVYRRMARELEVPGFRPGKAPKAVLLARYGDDLFDDEVKEGLIEEWLGRALREGGLYPVTRPRVEVVEFERGKRLSFRATFAVLPEVELPEELRLELEEVPAAEVEEPEVEEVLEDLKRRAALLQPKEAPAEPGDVVHFRHGERLYEVEVGREGVGEQLLGAKRGEVVTVRTEDGKAYPVEVAEVYRVILPAEEEVAAHYGEPSWEELRRKVEEGLLKRKEDERLERMRRAALDALADELGLEPPRLLLEEVVEEEMERLGRRPELRAEVEAGVRRRLRREILARRIAEKEGLLPAEEEVEELAQELGIEPAAARARLIFERAADWVIAKAKEGK